MVRVRTDGNAMTPQPSPDVAVVAGGTTGIGLATVRVLRAAGRQVALFSSSPAKVQAAADALAREDGPAFHAAAADVQDGGAVADLLQEIRGRLGPPTTLVYCAGLSPKRNGLRIPLHETPTEEWQRTFDVNLTGAFHAIRCVLPDMIEARLGRIVLVGSMGARALPRLAGSPYVAAKAAMAGLMRSVIGEYGAHGVTCNIVAPGNVLTDMVRHLPMDRLAELTARVPCGRLGQAEDVAPVIELLCRRDSGFISGAIIDVNGGEFIAL